jgi:hypothetical protein
MKLAFVGRSWSLLNVSPGFKIGSFLSVLLADPRPKDSQMYARLRKTIVPSRNLPPLIGITPMPTVKQPTSGDGAWDGIMVSRFGSPTALDSQM